MLIVGSGAAKRRSPMANPFQQGVRFEQRQANDVGVGSDDLADVCRRQPLDGVTAGLAAPLSAGDVVFEFVARQPFEGDRGAHQTLAYTPVRDENAQCRRRRGDARRTAEPGTAAPRLRPRAWAQCGGRGATTVSAPSTIASAWVAATARALADASRRARFRGNSPFSGVSSISAGTIRSGRRPICSSSETRREDADARTNFNGGGRE